MRQVLDLSEVEFASYPQRILARLIDILIVSFIFAIFLSLVGFEPDRSAGLSGDFGLGAWIWAMPVFYLGYEIPTTASRGQTIGKRLLGITIVRTDGEVGIGLDRALNRFITLIVLWCIPFVGILGLTWYFFDPKRQNLPDKAARTYVIRAPKRSHEQSEEYYVPPGEE